jgi:hypothetical protein
VQQSLPLFLYRSQQPLLFEHVLHSGACFFEQAVLLLNHATRPFHFFRNSNPHPVNNIENTLFINQ